MLNKNALFDKDSIKKLVDFANMNKIGIRIMANQPSLIQCIQNISAFFIEKYNLSDFKYIILNQQVKEPSLPIFIPFDFYGKKIPIVIDKTDLVRTLCNFTLDHIEYCLKKKLPILIYNVFNVSDFELKLSGTLAEPNIFIGSNDKQYVISDSLNFVEFCEWTNPINNLEFEKISMSIRRRFLCVYVNKRGILDDEIYIDPLQNFRL